MKIKFILMCIVSFAIFMCVGINIGVENAPEIKESAYKQYNDH